MKKKLINGDIWIVCDICQERMMLGEKVNHELHGVVENDNLVMNNGDRCCNVHAPNEKVFNTHVKCLETQITPSMSIAKLKEVLARMNGEEQQEVYRFLYYVCKRRI